MVNATTEDAVKYLARAIPKILCPQQEIKWKNISNLKTKKKMWL
jgi:hypothetical protein